MQAFAEAFSVSDPLYELNLFSIGKKENPFRFFFVGSGGAQDLVLYRDLINTFELNRLNFLKQAGLLFLIFPSATHTRFAHSLGTLTLGTYAIEHIWVKGGRTSTPVKLEEFLGKSGLIEEFLLALLLHDIGHLPFSHYLETNKSVCETFTSHEKISLRLLDSTDPLHAELAKRAQAAGAQTVVDVCKADTNIQMDKIIGLLDETGSNTNPVAQLVCGPLDLDRLDHYNRDSYFMGLKLSNINVRGFLGSIVLDMHDRQLKLRPEGVQHVLNLLFSKEMLWQRALDTEYSRAYEAMFNSVMDKWLDNARLMDLPFLKEEELLGELFSHPRAAPLLNRIFSRRPYPQVLAQKSSLSAAEISARYTEWCKIHASDPDDFILFLPKGFGTQSDQSGWLSEHIQLLSESGVSEPKRCLRDLHGDLFDYFRKQHQGRLETLRIFARSQELADSCRKAAGEFF